MASGEVARWYKGFVELDEKVCYRALRTRDARFDGRFFTAVRSTGIYCRPICPARTPKRANCTFFPCAAAAQEAGYRPCLRCRPEASPGTPAWLGTSATVSRALRLIGDGVLDAGDVASLAARLGIGERHLRRLFTQHLGASPISVAQTRRVLFAKKLLNETHLPMTQVALASGFSSVRRFNDALRGVYGRPPRELRRSRANPSRSSRGITLRLPYRRPLPWPALLGFLGARAIPGVESVSEGVYRRTARLDGEAVQIEVRALADEDALLARIDMDDATGLIDVAERLRRVFDLGADPEVIRDQLSRDRDLAGPLRAHPGLRVPGAWDGFELAVRAVLGQQVSVAAATTFAGRLVRRFGDPIDSEPVEGERLYLFPTPERLARADLTKIGVTRARAQAISGLSKAVARGDVALDASQGLDASVEALASLPGIGPWTAQYIAMRALREPDAFPRDDLGLRKALGNGRGPLTARALADRAEAWRPWRAYAAMALWQSLSA